MKPKTKPDIGLGYEQQPSQGKTGQTGDVRTPQAQVDPELDDQKDRRESKGSIIPMQPGKSFIETLEEEMQRQDQFYLNCKWEMDIPLTPEPETLPRLEDLAQVAVQELAHMQADEPQDEGPILAALREQWRTSIAFDVDPPEEERRVQRTNGDPRRCSYPRWTGSIPQQTQGPMTKDWRN